jgi:hypothetical protein
MKCYKHFFLKIFFLNKKEVQDRKHEPDPVNPKKQPKIEIKPFFLDYYFSFLHIFSYFLTEFWSNRSKSSFFNTERQSRAS